ncbi:MAG: quinolinate synthase NadA, partial [Methanospirillum sp.]
TVIVGTDISILYRMRKLAPNKILVPASHLMSCADMRMITLDLIEEAVRTRTPVVRVDPAVALGARRALERMLEVDADGALPERNSLRPRLPLRESLTGPIS